MLAEAELTRVLEAEAWVRARAGNHRAPGIGVVLGSGLGAFAATVESPVAIPYAEIPHFPRHQVIGHGGELVLGTVAGISVALMSGRFHYYQCGSAAAAAFPIRVLARLGVRQVVMTNAAGGINRSFAPGAVVLIRDHINFIPNPLVGPNDDHLGPRFCDLTHAYSPRLRALARGVGAQTGLALQDGVYIAVTGPSYETPAEIRAFAALGADMVGMSTAPEVIVARHAGLEVLGLSIITNMAAGILDQPINHAEVLETGEAVKDRLLVFLRALIPALAEKGNPHGA